MEPVSVSRHNRKQVLKNLYGGLRNEKPKAPRFKMGDVVRINKQKLHFEKGYEQNWRRELFIVFEIVQRIPIVYRLKDLEGEEIKGTYYEAELQKVVDSGFYPVENVIKQRKRGGITEYFVKFLGYPEKFNDWVTDIQKAPLLRIVRTKGKDGETISQYYDRPQYLPLVRHSFQTIQSELRLNSGDFVPFERGQIGSGLTHYKGINFQKGYGIGGIFRRLFRAALPFLVKGGKTIGKEVLMTGSRVASDVLSGENFKEAVKTRSKESGKKISSESY
ncbi:chromo domain-containing protein [Trichonephila clavipes]|nr:chromo domain-containing protein [Trichonephila clavipes]